MFKELAFVCLGAHKGNLYNFPLLKAKIAKAVVKLRLDIFCVDSYVAIEESFENTMTNSLVEEAKPPEILEWNTVEREMHGK